MRCGARSERLWLGLPWLVALSFFLHAGADDELSSAEVRQEAGEQVLKLIPRLERRVELGDQVGLCQCSLTNSPQSVVCLEEPTQSGRQTACLLS